jgi:hypothetical protein
MPAEWAAVLVAQGFLLATYLLLLAYVRQRFPAAPKRLPIYVLLALGLLPPTFFMRMAYSESMFLFLTVLAMYGMLRKWPWWGVALIVGLATATRLTGVALLLPLIGYVWNGIGHGGDDDLSPPGSGSIPTRSASKGPVLARNVGIRPLQALRVGVRPLLALRVSIRSLSTNAARRCPLRVAGAIVIGLSGLMAYMVYQGFAFGEPLAFAKSQDFWRHRVPDGLGDKVLGLASFGPLWLAYVPGSPGYARLLADPAPRLLSLQFANPVFFVVAAGLVIAGAWKGWLSRSEIALAAGLILIPYAAKGFEMCMASQARFVAAAFPIYIVLGHILSRLPRQWALSVLIVLGTYLALYAAMLAAGYVLI